MERTCYPKRGYDTKKGTLGLSFPLANQNFSNLGRQISVRSTDTFLYQTKLLVQLLLHDKRTYLCISFASQNMYILFIYGSVWLFSELLDVSRDADGHIREIEFPGLVSGEAVYFTLFVYHFPLDNIRKSE